MYLTHFPREYYTVADHSVKALVKPTWTLQPTYPVDIHLKSEHCRCKWTHLDMLSILPYLPDENILEVIASGELPLPTSLLKGEQTLKSCYNGTVLDSNNFSIWVSCMPRTILIRDDKVLDVIQNGCSSSSFSYIEFNPLKVLTRAYKLWTRTHAGDCLDKKWLTKRANAAAMVEKYIKNYLTKFQKEVSGLSTDIICINYMAMIEGSSYFPEDNGKTLVSGNWPRYNLDYRYRVPQQTTCAFEPILKILRFHGLTDIDLGNSVHMLPDGYSSYITPYVVIPKRVLLSEGEKNLNSTLNLASPVIHAWSEFFTLNNLKMSHECDNKWSEVFNGVCAGKLSVVDQSNVRELAKDAYKGLLNNNQVIGCLDNIVDNIANDDAVKLWSAITDIGDFAEVDDTDHLYSYKDPLNLLQKVITVEPVMGAACINMPMAYIVNHSDLPTDADVEYNEVSCSQDDCEHCSIEDYENCQNMEPDYDNPYVKYSATQHFLSHGIVDAMSTTYDYLQNYEGDGDTLQEMEITNDFTELTEVLKDDGKIVNIRGLRDTGLVIPLGKIWLTDNKEAFEREQLRSAVDELIKVNLITLDNIRDLLDSERISKTGMIINEALRNALPSLMQKYTIQISNLLTEFPPSLPF